MSVALMVDSKRNEIPPCESAGLAAEWTQRLDHTSATRLGRSCAQSSADTPLG